MPAACTALHAALADTFGPVLQHGGETPHWELTACGCLVTLHGQGPYFERIEAQNEQVRLRVARLIERAQHAVLAI